MVLLLLLCVVVCCCVLGVRDSLVCVVRAQAAMTAVLFVPPLFWTDEDTFLGVKMTSIVSGVSNGVVIPLFNQLYVLGVLVQCKPQWSDEVT